MSEHAGHGSSCCNWVALLMAIVAASVPLIKSAEVDSANKLSLKFGLFEICSNVNDGDDTCSSYPEGSDVLGGNVFTMQALYITALVLLFLGTIMASTASFLARSSGEMKAKTANASYLSFFFNFLGGIFFLASGIYMVCQISDGIHQIPLYNDLLSQFGKNNQITYIFASVDDGWNYTFIYTWIGCLQCWSAASMSALHAQSCKKCDEGHTHHHDNQKTDPEVVTSSV